jgi:hypothetical protein
MNAMNENELWFLMILIVCALIAWILWLISNHVRQSRALKNHTQLQNKLLDKFTSSQDAYQYLNSEAGKSLWQLQVRKSRDVFGEILAAIKVGVVALSLGLACIALRSLQQMAFAREIFLILGALLLALGFGFVVSSAISYYLSKSWGLLNRQTTNN